MQLLLDTSHEGYLTDRITGELILDADNKPQRLSQDVITGKWYKKIAEHIPTDKDDKSAMARAAAIRDQNPQQAKNASGYWVELPDYSPFPTEAEVAAAKAKQK